MLINFLKENKMKENLAVRIQELRKQKGWSQIELADKIGLSKAQMSRYETKNVQPPADTLNKIATALDTTIDYLISGDKTEKAKAAIKNSELLQSFKEMDVLPEQEQTMLVKIIRAYVRDFKARQTYAV
jgi:transcriptional regulator with XRE-family HTH domain